MLYFFIVANKIFVFALFIFFLLQTRKRLSSLARQNCFCFILFIYDMITLPGDIKI